MINKKPKNQDDIILNIDGTKQNNPDVITNEFNKFFTSVASKIQTDIPKIGNFEDFVTRPNSASSFFFTPVTSSEVMKILKELDHTKSSGLFSIPKQIINSVTETLSDIIKELINLTFETGIFPDSLKLVKVIPIFKNKGSDQDVNNYRPISLLSNIDKIFEKLVASRLNLFLEKFNMTACMTFLPSLRHLRQMLMQEA